MADEFVGALVGCGYFAQNHMHAWGKHVQGGTIRFLCDTNAKSLASTGEAFGIRPECRYSSLSELLEKERLDFIDVATQPNSHRPIVKQICEKGGINIICQKPMGNSVEEACAMVEDCEKAKVTLMIHENFRFQPAMQEVKKLMIESKIGEPFWGQVSFRSAWDVYTNQPYLATDERFIIFDLGVHLFDLARFFMGDVKSIMCQKQRVNPKIVAEDSATALLTMSSGATCVVDMSYFSKLESEVFPQALISLDCANGSLRLERDFSITLVDPAGVVSKKEVPIPATEWMDKGPGSLIQASIGPTQQHFIDCLREGSQPQTSGADNLKTFKLTMAAYDSADVSQPVQM